MYSHVVYTLILCHEIYGWKALHNLCSYFVHILKGFKLIYGSKFQDVCFRLQTKMFPSVKQVTTSKKKNFSHHYIV